MISKILEWNSSSVKLSVETNFFLPKSGRKSPQNNHLNDVVSHTKCQRSNFTIKKKYHEKHILYVFYIRLLLKPRNG